jgi:hypothetical protein
MYEGLARSLLIALDEIQHFGTGIRFNDNRSSPGLAWCAAFEGELPHPGGACKELHAGLGLGGR